MASTTTKLLLVPVTRFGDTHLMNGVDVVDDDDVLVVGVNVISEFGFLFCFFFESTHLHKTQIMI